MSDKTADRPRVYKTADIVMAATLIELGMKVVRVEQIPEKSRHEIYKFVFADVPERDRYISDFTSKNIKVEPQAFAQNIRNLKQMIKEDKQSQQDGSN